MANFPVSRGRNSGRFDAKDSQQILTTVVVVIITYAWVTGCCVSVGADFPGWERWRGGDGGGGVDVG